MEDNNDLSNNLNSMFDSKSLDDIKLAQAILNNTDLVSKNEIKNHWYNINELTTDALKSSELYYSDEKSDKVYLVFLRKSDGKFVVDVYYGRRGKSLVYDLKGHFPTQYSAELDFNEVLKSKIKKGYKLVNETNYEEANH